MTGSSGGRDAGPHSSREADGALPPAFARFPRQRGSLCYHVLPRHGSGASHASSASSAGGVGSVGSASGVGSMGSMGSMGSVAESLRHLVYLTSMPPMRAHASMTSFLETPSAPGRL